MILLRIVAIFLVFLNVQGVCPPNITEGTYGLWSPWSDCSVTCGGGRSWRSKGLCCPNANGTLIDCRSTYNLTELILYEFSNCSQKCSNGTFVSGMCVCSNGYTDSCCNTAVTTMTNRTGYSVHDPCTSKHCSVLMTCSNLPGGGYHCDCEKVGNTNLCMYELLIILGCLALAGVATCLVVFFIGRKKRKVEGARMPISED